MKIKRLRRIHFLDDERVRILTDNAEFLEIDKKEIRQVFLIKFNASNLECNLSNFSCEEDHHSAFKILIYFRGYSDDCDYNFSLYYPILSEESDKTEKKAKKDFKKFQRWLDFKDEY